VAAVLGDRTAERDSRERSPHIEVMEEKIHPSLAFPQKYVPPLGFSV
jgi:hypothetical protein